MKNLSILSVLAATVATPALAASGPFFSLGNSNFVVLIAFVVFIAILVYAGVPRLLTGLLDKRSAQIKLELDEARLLREEAKTILASYERKQKEVMEQSQRIVVLAQEEAMAAAAKAKEELQISIERRLKSAEEQILAAETAAIRQVRESAVAVAVVAAGDVLAKQMSADKAAASIDEAIAQVGAKLH